MTEVTLQDSPGETEAVTDIITELQFLRTMDCNNPDVEYDKYAYAVGILRLLLDQEE